MIAEKLKNEIEKYATHLNTSSPLFLNARRGTLRLNEVHQYLANIHFLIGHTPVYLQRAKERAQELGKTELERYYAAKLAEEAGHDQWSESDMKMTGARMERAPSPAVKEPMRELVEYVGGVIQEDPTLYLPYILLAEYLTVLMAPGFLHDLNTRCGISPEMMSVVGNHAELDKAHVKEGLEEIDKLAGGDYEMAFLRVLRASMFYYEQFLSEVGEPASDGHAHVH